MNPAKAGETFMAKLWRILTQIYHPYIVPLGKNIFMILKVIMDKVKSVWSSGLHQSPPEPSCFTPYYRMVRSTIDCLSQLFFKNIFKEPKCPICKLTSYSCGTVLVIILLLLIILFRWTTW